MTDTQTDGPEGYTAADGSFVPIPALAPLADAPADLEPFRAPLRSAARASAERAFSGELDRLADEETHLDNPYLQNGGMTPFGTTFAGRHLSEDDKRARSATHRRVEAALLAARAARIRDADATADALLDALSSPETAGAFRDRLAAVLDYDPTRYANMYLSEAERRMPWLPALLAALPPARLAPALASLLSPTVFNPWRRWFHEPALAAFLDGPGDLAHLETGNADAPPPGHGAGPRSDLARRVVARVGLDLDPADLEAVPSVMAPLARPDVATGSPRPLAPGTCLDTFLRNPAMSRLSTLAPDRLWTYVARNLDLIDTALGLGPDPAAAKGCSPAAAMRALRLLPALPLRHHDAVYRLALGKKKSGRRDAQRLLRGTDGLIPRLAAETTKKSAEIRRQAAACLGETGEAAAIPVLEAMLPAAQSGAESNDILAALARLGADIRAHGPDQAALLAETETLPLPEDCRWLADMELPALTLADGSRAPEALGPHLLRVAAELGEPAGGPVLDLRTRHLDDESRRALARAALAGWIAHDTLRWDEISFETHRPVFARAMYGVYLELHELERNLDPRLFAVSEDRDRPPMSLDAFDAQIDEDQLKEFMRVRKNWAIYLNSAYAGRGVLGLAAPLSVDDLAGSVRAYLERHARRAPQARALLDLLAGHGAAAGPHLAALHDELTQKGLRSHIAETMEDLGLPPPMSDSGGQENAGPG